MSSFNKLKKTLIAFVLFFILSIVAAITFIHHQLEQPLQLKETQLLTLTTGTNFGAFTKQLVSLGAINSNIWLKSYVKMFPEKGKIKAGTYQITPQMNSIDLLVLLHSGKEHQFSITFIEGSTLKEWLNILQNHPDINHTLNSSDYSYIAKEVGLDHTYPEGLFFPDTYLFTANTSDLDILKRAHSKMDTLLNNEWGQRDENLPYKSPYEALIMASIIEKESGQHSEHQLISSVFINRLHKNMRLQTDPTVIYGLGERYKGDIKRIHLREKTPYNTYRINGLPPTPIAMPGKSAISAALHPEMTDYYYFVSKGNGEHVFSSNLEAHNQAVAKYILNK
ncbi:endolytic transglycosylase MltG [Thalassotalea profundi]|uniref:Endolytic murein transglycosylase n=1 Tax=Thalassotalea profundi TaxID=2036687 RepID=A0ABQ3IPM8_9GAMM|nr:endolytic transglycosylase MltG [Thalassotalea profundi]GHE90675.1 aminodeoxychorismate lyase [Thalassotalea profundi]